MFNCETIIKWLTYIFSSAGAVFLLDTIKLKIEESNIDCLKKYESMVMNMMIGLMMTMMRRTTMNKIMLTVKEASAITNIGVARLKMLMNEYPDFPYLKIGVKYLIIADKLVEWLNNHRGEVF